MTESVYFNNKNIAGEERDPLVFRIPPGKKVKIAFNVSNVNFSRRLEIYLDGFGSEVDVSGRFFASNENEMRLTLGIFHVGERTKGNVDIKSVLKGSALFEFEGLLDVGEKAFDADSYLSQKNLLISDGAKVKSTPSLRIRNNEVKCSHGVTTTGIPESELYYILSRGVSEKEAEDIIVEGFLQEKL